MEVQKQIPMDEETFQYLEKQAGFTIESCETLFDFDDKNRFVPLEMTSENKLYMSAVLQQIPTFAAAGRLANAYTVKFPKGMPHTLTELKQGGFGSMIRGEKGQFVGSASFYEMRTQAMLLSAFSAMSVATGQYFLSRINSELKMMNLKIDKILEFLYGDKKAELMSEVSFARYAYENYTSIMAHEAQRVATLTSLQESKKVAMKDIEFYMVDLDSSVNADAKNYSELEMIAQKTMQIRESLELSIQLYVMSSMLEVAYAQNRDAIYLSNLESTASVYIAKCEKRILSSLSVLNRRISEYKAKPLEKLEKEPLMEKLTGMIEQLNTGEESEIRKIMHSVLQQTTNAAEYYIRADGTMYAVAG